jgi:hypothetical protein
MRARKTSCEGIGPLVIGADPGREHPAWHTAIIPCSPLAELEEIEAAG